MSVVWAGTHLLTGKQVALKLLKGEASRDEAVRRRMLREARAACAVIHPNVVQIHDVLELPGGAPVLVMDLLQGESLRERLLRRKKLTIEETAMLLLPVVAGVGTAHAAGVIHRDLKPENIFLAVEAGETRVKVLDFGIAKMVATSSNVSQANALTNTGTMLGTPYYMAPEQILGEVIDHRADVWSLGVILYECLVGERPTEAENIGKILKRVLTHEIEPLSSRAPELPGEVKALVDRMLSQSEKARPASLHEVGEVLARYAPGMALGSFGPPSTTPDSASDRLPSLDDAARAARLGEVTSIPKRGDPGADLAETLMAPRYPEAPTKAAPHTSMGAVSVRPEAASATSEAHLDPASAPSTEAPLEAAHESPDGRPRGFVILLAAALIAAGGAAIFLFVGKGKERPYVPATPQVAEPGGDCPAGMGLVPGGMFRMGSDDGKDDERPVHEMKIDPFCMDLTEVTAGGYNDCTRKGACRPAESTVKWTDIPDDAKDRDSIGCNAYQSGNERLPMNCISWEDADAYCRIAGKRLPTEAEWELAAAGGDERRRYPWGAEPPSAKLLNTCDRSCSATFEKGGATNHRPLIDDDDGAPRTAPVGSYPLGAARYGMLDMAGNVWEWTASPYCTYPEHACSSNYKVFRGGGWGGTLMGNLRVTTRMWSHPSHRYSDVGFRCVKGP